MDSEVKSNRNSDVKCHKGFQYVFDKLINNDTTKSYRCRRRDINCKGRIHITPGEIRVENGHGGHDESPTSVVRAMRSIFFVGTIIILVFS
ncbi:unnamed protein product [Macrosiphum euphorbiae]|uniref:FLYWCH-type domain-containing protein n=1 Tax=Macrosiphum euphorbiae TaxID=13131 RepID=A0AAV0WCT1_9HEMI|nr:unnamed protein product [Macrosiphum euphorbiae]